MVDLAAQCPLPPSVEQILQTLCAEHHHSATVAARRQLAAVGEEAAVGVLLKIAAGRTPIRNLSAYIIYMTKPARCCSPQKKLCLGPTSHPSPFSSARRVLVFPKPEAPEHPRDNPTFPGPPRLQQVSPQMEALGELEFRRAFLILHYLGERPEEALRADEIQRLKHVEPMQLFEEKVWSLLGAGSYHVEGDRLKYLDWDTGKTHQYYCHVRRNATFRFKGPYLENTRTHLQRELGDENVLLVKFEDATSGRDDSVERPGDLNTLYSMITKAGINVALRCFRFFVFKDGGREERKKSPTTSSVKCVFIRMESDASYDANRDYILHGKTVPEARRMFMHAHTVSSMAKYMARFSLILSKTVKSAVDLASVNVQRIDDINCEDEWGNIVLGKDGKPLIHTDGTGFISHDLALECAKSIHVETTGNKSFKRSRDGGAIVGNTCTREPPLLIQCRLFKNGLAVKGTLLVNKKLPNRTVQVRPSMIKVETDPELPNIQTFNSLEINGTSNQPNRAYLSKNLIALLRYGGVPEKFFMGLLNMALEESYGAFSSLRAAYRACRKHEHLDAHNITRNMILSGIPLHETYVRYQLSNMWKEELKSIKGGKLHVPDCYYLMGTTDPTGILKEGQVCVILDHGQVSGDVLVYRNPGLHFGDIHVLKAVHVKGLESIVGNAKYAIFFPCKGRRSLGDEIAGGDFDGDMYWVSRNPQLLEYYKKEDPWISAYSTPDVQMKRPSQFSPDELEDELFKQFLTTRFQPSYTIGVAADSWLALMDRLLTLGNDCADEKASVKQNILRLIDIYYDALDAPKKGLKIDVPQELRAEMFPHYMERENSFHSKSILGKIYDTVDAYASEDPSMEVCKLPDFDVKPPEHYMKKWETLYHTYRQDMKAALRYGDCKEECAAEVIKKYKNILYNADEFDKSKKDEEVIFAEALAIYNVCYDYAKSQGSAKLCNFPWKIAGSALCTLYLSNTCDDPIPCNPSVIREILR